MYGDVMENKEIEKIAVKYNGREQYKKNEIMINEDTVISKVYIFISGEIKVTSHEFSSKGHREIIKKIGKWQYFRINIADTLRFSPVTITVSSATAQIVSIDRRYLLIFMNIFLNKIFNLKEYN